LNELLSTKYHLSSQNYQLDVNQSGFKKGHSTETALLSVTEALQIAKAASKSSVDKQFPHFTDIN